MSVKDKIKERMDQLQDMMEENLHLTNPQEVIEKIHEVSKFWSVLSDEDRDYIHGARYAIEESVAWDILEKDKRINKEK